MINPNDLLTTLERCVVSQLVNADDPLSVEEIAVALKCTVEEINKAIDGLVAKDYGILVDKYLKK